MAEITHLRVDLCYLFVQVFFELPQALVHQHRNHCAEFLFVSVLAVVQNMLRIMHQETTVQYPCSIPSGWTCGHNSKKKHPTTLASPVLPVLIACLDTSETCLAVQGLVGGDLLTISNLTAGYSLLWRYQIPFSRIRLYNRGQWMHLQLKTCPGSAPFLFKNSSCIGVNLVVPEPKDPQLKSNNFLVCRKSTGAPQ